MRVYLVQLKNEGTIYRYTGWCQGGRLVCRTSLMYTKKVAYHNNICPLQAVFAVRKTDDVDPIGVNTTMTPAPLEENTFAKAIAA